MYMYGNNIGSKLTGWEGGGGANPTKKFKSLLSRPILCLFLKKKGGGVNHPFPRIGNFGETLQVVSPSFHTNEQLIRGFRLYASHGQSMKTYLTDE